MKKHLEIDATTLASRILKNYAQSEKVIHLLWLSLLHQDYHTQRPIPLRSDRLLALLTSDDPDVKSIVEELDLEDYFSDELPPTLSITPIRNKLSDKTRQLFGQATDIFIQHSEIIDALLPITNQQLSTLSKLANSKQITHQEYLALCDTGIPALDAIVPLITKEQIIKSTPVVQAPQATNDTITAVNIQYSRYQDLLQRLPEGKALLVCDDINNKPSRIIVHLFSGLFELTISTIGDQLVIGNYDNGEIKYQSHDDLRQSFLDMFPVSFVTHTEIISILAKEPINQTGSIPKLHHTRAEQSIEIHRGAGNPYSQLPPPRHDENTDLNVTAHQLALGHCSTQPATSPHQDYPPQYYAPHPAYPPQHYAPHPTYPPQHYNAYQQYGSPIYTRGASAGPCRQFRKAPPPHEFNSTTPVPQ